MLNLIVAPKSYNKEAERKAKRIVSYLKSKREEYSVYFSLDIEDLTSNIEYLISLGETEFVLFGDDRIVNLFVNTVKDLSKIRLGIVPTSRHDDFASYLGVSHKPIVAIKDILKRNVQNVDLMLCNDVRVVNNVIIGASVDIYEAFNKYKWKNIITEKYASLKYSKLHNPNNLKVDVKNTKTRNEKIFELIIANGGFSKGKRISPLSNVKDGLFNLIYLPEQTKKMTTKSIRSIFRGEHIYRDDAVQIWGNEVRITSENQEIRTMIDGELYNLERIDLVVKEGALKIYKTN